MTRYQEKCEKLATLWEDTRRLWSPLAVRALVRLAQHGYRPCSKEPVEAAEQSCQDSRTRSRLLSMRGSGLVKSRDRYHKMIERYPERADFYRAQIVLVEAEIIKLQVCRRCGRPLKDPQALERGYGKECQAITLAELEATKTEND